MKRQLKILIDVDDQVCSSEAGLCSRMVASHFGSRFLCGLFGDSELRDTKGVLSGPGKLVRLQACKEAEANIHSGRSR